MIRRLMSYGLAAVAGVAAAPVWAQLQVPGQVNNPRLEFWIVMMVSLFLAAVVVTGSLLSSRRGHLD